MCLGVPGKIISIEAHDDIVRTGVVEFSSIRKQINLSYVPEANCGDYVIVHVGFAISTVDPEAAERTIACLDEAELL